MTEVGLAEAIYTLREVAARLKVSMATVYRMRKAGRLRGVWISDKVIRVTEGEVQRVLREAGR